MTPDSINAALSIKEAQIVDRAGEEIEELFHQQIDAAEEAMSAQARIGVGDIAPDFSLPATSGDIVTLSDVLEHQPVILTFYRGSWCAFCNSALPVWQRALPAVESKGARLVAISPETLDRAQEFRESAGLTYDLLSDEGNKTAAAYGLVFRIPDAACMTISGFGINIGAANGNGDWSVPATATFVIGKDGRILLADCGPDYRRRLEPEAALAVI